MQRLCKRKLRNLSDTEDAAEVDCCRHKQGSSHHSRDEKHTWCATSEGHDGQDGEDQVRTGLRTFFVSLSMCHFHTVFGLVWLTELLLCQRPLFLLQA